MPSSGPSDASDASAPLPRTAGPRWASVFPASADFDEVARAFRNDAARCSDMMSPRGRNYRLRLVTSRQHHSARCYSTRGRRDRSQGPKKSLARALPFRVIDEKPS